MFLVSPGATGTSENETKRSNKEQVGKREHRAKRGSKRKKGAKGGVELVRLRPSRMRADAGKEPDTRRDKDAGPMRYTAKLHLT